MKRILILFFLSGCQTITFHGKEVQVLLPQQEATCYIGKPYYKEIVYRQRYYIIHSLDRARQTIKEGYWLRWQCPSLNNNKFDTIHYKYLGSGKKK